MGGVALLLRLVTHELVDNQTEKLLGFAVLVEPAEMLAAIAAARGLPDVALEPGVFIGGGAADVAAGGEFEAADVKLKSIRIDEAMLMATAYNEFFVARGNRSMTEMAEN